MLKNIPKNLSPELIKILMEMGHGDELVIGDGNFPAQNYGARVVRCDGQNGAQLLEAILTLLPLDQYSEKPVALMEVAAGDSYVPEIWDVYKDIMIRAGEKIEIEYVERFAFYERAKQAYAIVASSEEALYANIIIKKGVI